MEKWKSLFLPIFLSSHSLKELAQDIPIFINRWHVQFLYIRNIYFLIHIQDDVECIIWKYDTRIDIKTMIQTICDSCPLLQECSVEIKFTSNAIRNMSYILRTRCMYYIFELCSRIPLRHNSIHFRFILHATMFYWLYRNNYISVIDNAYTMFSHHSYGYAIELTTYNFSTVLSRLISYDTHHTIQHISINWGSTLYNSDNNQVVSSIVQQAQKFGFLSYQFWHFYRKEKKYCSAYLDSCYYMLPYIGIKFNKGKSKTVSWRQGQCNGDNNCSSVIPSAIGMYTSTFRWKKISAWEELALRCMNSNYGIIYIPQYLYNALGKTEMKLFKKRGGFKTLMTEDCFPYHNRNDYIHHGEFWSS